MKLYAISDLHLALSIDKPMDVFGSNWENYMDKIAANWSATVDDDDVVLVPGDLSWATYMDEAGKDFDFLESLPGTKLLGRGNHDYYWSTLTKMERFFTERGYKTFKFIRNTATTIDCDDGQSYVISGTRGWRLPGDKDFLAEDQKIFDREMARLKICCENIVESDPDHISKRIIMLHYPPITRANGNSEMIRLMIEYGIDLCIYGHLHGPRHRVALEGNDIYADEGGNTIALKCVASDYLGFVPWQIDV